MKANSFRFNSATSTYEGNRKCSQFFNFRGISTIMGVLDTIQEQWCGNKYKNRLSVGLSYVDEELLEVSPKYNGTDVILTIDFFNDAELYVLTNKDVLLPLTDKTVMKIDAGVRTYIGMAYQDGTIEWNEHAEGVKVDKFKCIRASMIRYDSSAKSQIFNFSDADTLTDVLAIAVGTCYTGQDRRRLEIDLMYERAKIRITLYFWEQILVYAESNTRICVPITTEIERTLEADKNTYVWLVDGEGEYDTEEDVIEAKEPKEAVEDVRSYNVGASDYAKHKIQPWSIWFEYKLNPWDADIIKRVLRDKPTDGRKLDYEKIIHICKERIRQIDLYGE